MSVFILSLSAYHRNVKNAIEDCLYANGEIIQFLTKSTNDKKI